MMDKNNKLLRSSLKIFIAVIIILVLLFVPAGTFYWIEAWILMIAYLIYVGMIMFWLKRNNPELLKERTLRKKEGKGWDKLILLIYTLPLFVMLIVCGFDAVRFKWTNVPLIIKIVGFIGYVPSAMIIFLTVKENAYLSKVVRIQKDRSHQVVKTGPYRYVRHPMYVGIILMIIATPFALGSFVALIISGLIIILFIIRTYLEDKTLQKELSGYLDYTKEVPYRLIPGIW